MDAKTRSHLFLFTVAVIYGANFTIAKLVLDPHHIEPEALIILRVTFTLALTWLFFRTQWKAIRRTDHATMLLCGITGVAFNQVMFFKGLQLTTPLHASLMMLITPILVFLFAVFGNQEQFRLSHLLGILLGCLGAGLLVLQKSGAGEYPDQRLGDLYVFLNAASYSVYLVIVRNMMSRYDPITVMGWVFLYGLPFVVPFGAQDLIRVNWSGFPLSVWMALGFIIIFTTFLAYLLNSLALRHLSSSVVGFYIYLQPLVAGLLSVSLGTDHLNALLLLSAGLIFSGVFLVSRKSQEKKAKPA